MASAPLLPNTIEADDDSQPNAMRDNLAGNIGSSRPNPTRDDVQLIPGSRAASSAEDGGIVRSLQPYR
jgi:hypothetical protein